MTNLIPVATNSLLTFSNIGKNKQNKNGNNRRDRILLLTPTITPRYLLYSQHFANNTLENIPSVNYEQQIHEDMLHCYASKTKSLSQLIRDIKDNQYLHLKGTCQFCGINTDSTTDHYLPKETFPDFCVHSLNLFPCCPDCNSLKGEYMWDNAYNSRGIINLYTDNIPNTQFLFATINYIEEVPTVEFTINNNNGIPPNLYTIIARHFKRLHLLDRYKEKFNSVHHQVRSSFQNKIRFAGHPARVREFLLDDANQLFNSYGRNYYIGIIKQALANTPAFVNQF